MKSNILCILSCYLLILSAAAMSRAATGSGTGAGVTFQPGVSSQVATPVFSPGGGTYTGAQQVAISDATDGAFIGYTTDGSTPSESGGGVAHGTLLLNVGSVSISANTTLKAIAFEGGLADSPVVTAVYNIQSATPAFSLAAGTYIGTQSVSISSAANGVSRVATMWSSGSWHRCARWRLPPKVHRLALRRPRDCRVRLTGARRKSTSAAGRCGPTSLC